MASNFSFDTLNKMDTILNKELSRIGESKHNLPPYSDKENIRSQFASTDTYKSTFTGAHHSRRSSNCAERSPRVTFKDTSPIADQRETDMNFKMQKQLLSLQAKVIELEMKMSSMNSPGIHDQARKTYTPSNCVSLANTMESSKINSNHGSPVSRELELKSSLRTTVNHIHGERVTPYSRVSPILQQDNLGLSRISQEESEMRMLGRSTSGMSVQTFSRSTIKKSSKRESKGGFDSSTSRTSCNTASKTNYSATSRNSTTKKGKENMSRVYEEYEEENMSLHKLVNKYKREYNEDKAALVKERVRGNELAEKIEKLNKKMMKMEKTLKTASKAQDGYGDLIGSFEKSENIRKQQRNIIESLNSEIRLLKGEKELDASIENSFKKIISSKKTKSGKKAAKAF